ncbi:rna-directed dna polymerase from mobile element jockey-like [Pitangus sulphuratus]|nr:rna-directed dna polymerase from mobile element jockey-like [Pitangus sulphuratus]
MGSGTGDPFSKFASDTLGGRDTIQRDPDRLERWPCANLMKFSKAKCKVLHVGWGNPKHRYNLGRDWILNSSAGEDLRVLVDEKHDMTRQCVLVAQKVNCILCCILAGQQVKGSDSAPLFHSPETSPEYCVHLWRPQLNKDVDLLE